MECLLFPYSMCTMVLCILVNAGVFVAGFRLSSPRKGYGWRKGGKRAYMEKTICTKERFAIERAAAGIIGNVICFRRTIHDRSYGHRHQTQIIPLRL